MKIQKKFNPSAAANPAMAPQCHAEAQWRRFAGQNRSVFEQPGLMSDDPIKRTTKLILFQSQQDHATELVVRSRPGTGAAIRYKVSETWHDWNSPGPELAPAIIDEIGRLATFTKRPFPKEGLIDVPYSGVRLLWVVRMESVDGDCILSPVDR